MSFFDRNLVSGQRCLRALHKMRLLHEHEPNCAIRFISQVPEGPPSEGHNPARGSLRKFASQRALRGFLSLRGLCAGSAESLPRVLQGSAGIRRIFRGFSGVVTLLGDGETTIKIKFSLFEGGGGSWGAERKIVQNAVFRGTRHDNKISKVQILLSRNLLSLHRLLPMLVNLGNCWIHVRFESHGS